jgi:hypothetical protein
LVSGSRSLAYGCLFHFLNVGSQSQALSASLRFSSPLSKSSICCHLEYRYTPSTTFQ